ncbi:LOW QUALITY PROTEIN: hypothetical protein ElyMa_000240500 [Elysia marginata]|uniref:Uncharacterized protein n=1 Tax=Elysia marginata TaxID=1093978 RepID=A0AAV4F142_9GAST|nr:LOW QUALITY PROTEIN: hypothetical protein ElyMa_000240500 [Elysia marginata]
MLPGARLIACRLARLNHQDPRSNAHGSHLTANKVPNSRERSRFRGIEESDRMTEVRQEDGKNLLPLVACILEDWEHPTSDNMLAGCVGA